MQCSSNFCNSFIAGLLCLSSKLLNSCALNQPMPQEKSNHLLCIFLCFVSSCLQDHTKSCVNLLKLFLFVGIPISLMLLATSFVLFLHSSKTKNVITVSAKFMGTAQGSPADVATSHHLLKVLVLTSWLGCAVLQLLNQQCVAMQSDRSAGQPDQSTTMKSGFSC